MFTIPLVIIIIVIFFIWKNKNVDIVSKEDDIMKIINCEYAPDLHYWNYWSKNYNYNEHNYEEIKNKRQGNFYIECKSDGTAKMINAYIFKDDELFFKKENIYRGKFFADNEDNFYIIQGIMNPEANASPLGYILTRYEFDSSKNTLAEKETSEYKTKQEIENLYKFEKEKNVYFEDDDFYKNIINNKYE